jgi:hypothetical protein
MTCWIRTGFGACLSPDRLLPEDARAMKEPDIERDPPPAKPRPVKPAGELLTEEEFVFFGGIGEFDLAYEVGFHFQVQDENKKPVGPKFEITTRAVARLERKLVEDKTKIALKSISTPELAKLLEAGGAVEGSEYFEGPKGSSLPTPLRLGISQNFARLKKAEAKAS